MAKRKDITKKLRFEVFKRDSFTCQYCGKSAPDVVLEIDHIKPHVKGGKDDILNLTTSCFDCNRGKGKRELSDNTVLKKQTDQLKQLNEKQQQLEMMIKWRTGLLKCKNKEIDVINTYCAELSGKKFNGDGEKIIKKLVRKFGLDHVLKCIEISFDNYLRYEKDEITDNSWEYAFSKIGGVCYVNSLSDDEKQRYFKIGNLKRIIYETFDYYEKYELFRITKKILNSKCNIDTIIEDSSMYKNWDNWVSYIRKQIEY